ncbi:hypothetical protein ACFL4F_01315, partial [Candidatus Margulisiibacteriota bacterium]
SPANGLQVGTATFTGQYGSFADERTALLVGEGSGGGAAGLVGMQLSSTYNDANYPNYGLVLVNGASTSDYDVWGICHDGPAKAAGGLSFLYKNYTATGGNIHGEYSTPVMFLKKDGNVGIGTAAIADKLEVAGRVRVDEGGAYWSATEPQLYIGNNNTYGISAFTNKLYFWSDNGSFGWREDGTSVDVMTINGDGKVGIGTESPDVNFAVIGSMEVGAEGNQATGTYSIAMGSNSTARGNYSAAIGNANQSLAVSTFTAGVSNMATHEGSVALGYISHAGSGVGAVAMGMQSTAHGQGAVAIGQGCQARKIQAVALGGGTQANGSASFAVGGLNIATGDYSNAMGWQSTAAGTGSIAAGQGNYAAAYSAAFGIGARAYGAYALAAGYLSSAEANYSVAMGNTARASAANAFAIGSASSAGGNSAVAMGGGSVLAASDFSFAAGYASTARGQRSVAMGSQASTGTGGHYQVAIGRDVYANGDTAVAIGRDTTAQGNWSTATGYGIQVGSAVGNGNYSFGIGLGTVATVETVTANNVMAIMGGNVGIGTTEPTEKLTIKDGNYVSYLGDYNYYVGPVPNPHAAIAGTNGTASGYTGYYFSYMGTTQNVGGFFQNGSVSAQLARSSNTAYHAAYFSGTVEVTNGDIVLPLGTAKRDRGMKFDGTNEDLSIGDGTNSQIVHMGAWKTWTPTWTNLTVGNGTVTARYTKVGKFVRAQVRIVFGSTTAISGAVSFTTPSTMKTDAMTPVAPLGTATLQDVSGNYYFGRAAYNTSTSASVLCESVGATYSMASGLTSTIPFPWAPGDIITLEFSYEEN